MSDTWLQVATWFLNMTARRASPIHAAKSTEGEHEKGADDNFSRKTNQSRNPYSIQVSDQLNEESCWSQYRDEMPMLLSHFEALLKEEACPGDKTTDGCGNTAWKRRQECKNHHKTPTEKVITLPYLVISILQLEEAEMMQTGKATFYT